MLPSVKDIPASTLLEILEKSSLIKTGRYILDKKFDRIVALDIPQKHQVIVSDDFLRIVKKDPHFIDDRTVVVYNVSSIMPDNKCWYENYRQLSLYFITAVRRITSQLWKVRAKKIGSLQGNGEENVIEYIEFHHGSIEQARMYNKNDFVEGVSLVCELTRT